LLVEDEQSVRDLTVKMLQRLGYRVLVAAGGAEAIEISRSYAGTIALQVADALQAARPDLKVLYLSGYTEDTVVHHGVLDAGVEFLPKPFSREALGKKIRSVLGE